MRREILFRGIRRDNFEWVYGHYALDDQDEATIITLPPRQPIFRFKVKPETVGQFTGLTDKNGKNVYDGDFDADGNVVVWCQNCSGWNFGSFDHGSSEIYINCHNCEGDFMLMDLIPSFHIIGNIHEQQSGQ